jgi:hypothetical protein
VLPIPNLFTSHVLEFSIILWTPCPGPNRQPSFLTTRFECAFCKNTSLVKLSKFRLSIAKGLGVWSESSLLPLQKRYKTSPSSRSLCKTNCFRQTQSCEKIWINVLVEASTFTFAIRLNILDHPYSKSGLAS